MVARPLAVCTWLLCLITVTILLTVSLARAEQITIVPYGPINDLSLRPEQIGLIITSIPSSAFSALSELFSIEAGTGPAFFSNYKFAGKDFGGPLQIVDAVGAAFRVIPGFFTEYRVQHFSDTGTYGPEQAGVNMHLLEISFRF